MNRKYIFNKKLVNQIIDKYNFNNIKDINKKRKIIADWIYSINNFEINKVKEKNLQGKFLRDFFVETLGYKESIGNDNWSIIQEEKTLLDGKTPDAILGRFNNKSKKTKVVIELKDANTNLDYKQNRKDFKLSPVEQGFMYAPKYGSECKWIIVCNFIEIRLYHSSNQLQYESFQIKDLLKDKNFETFYYIFNQENLIGDDDVSIIDELYTKNENEQKKITSDFYKEYKEARLQLFEIIRENNNIDDVVILKKTQKLMDRFIFICFCENMNLIKANTFKRVIDISNSSYDFDETNTWRELKGLFKSIDKGNPRMKINKFNGGLFAEDIILDSLIIPNSAFKHLENLAEYDFKSELNVNILGHIFEQSLSDLEEIKKELLNKKINKSDSKKKKDGIYYTPESITSYMVEKSVGKWLDDKKHEIGIYDLPELPEYKTVKTTAQKISYTKTIGKHKKAWEKYAKVLSNVKILDPACGSGAFLIAVFDLLYREGQEVNNKLGILKGGKDKLFDYQLGEVAGGQFSLFDIDKNILKNNLFGVDINEESVEITKLSLWLKTANKNEPLTSLDKNIKCGNSLRNDKFNWNEEYKDIMEAGGFDIIVGNPPYGAKISDDDKVYFKENYFSASKQNGGASLDTFSLFIELAMKLGNKNSITDYIVPLSVTSSDSMEGIHNLLYRNCSEIEISSYSNRPTRIFEQADQRVSILRFKKDGIKNQHIYTTTVNKRYSGTSIREMLSQLKFTESKDFIKRGRIPKIGTEIERSILKKLYSSDSTLKDIYKKGGNPIFYRTSGGRYFNIVTNFPTMSSKERPLYIEPKYSNFVGALLSSNLYYWFLHIYSNNLDLKLYELDIMPINLKSINDEKLKKINKIYEEYIIDLKRNSKVRKAAYENTPEFREYYARMSKEIIDKIDYELMDIYGFTEDEVNFIIEFDGKFRG